MDDRSSDFRQKVKELHEKARQDAMGRYRGRELEEALKKLDGIYRPLEKMTPWSMAARGLGRKRILALAFLLATGVALFVLSRKSMNAVLHYGQWTNLAAFCVLLPILSSAAFYLISLHLLRQQARGVNPPVTRYGPLPRYTAVSLFSLAVGLCGLFTLFYMPLSIGMGVLNSRPVAIHSTLEGIEEDRRPLRSGFVCLVSSPAPESGGAPVEERLVLGTDALELPLKQGDRVLVVGRESFAGVIVDRIRKDRAAPGSSP